MTAPIASSSTAGGRPKATGRRYRGKSHEDRQVERAERLRAAALDLYGTQGFQLTTIEQLCRAAGITARHFYEAYPTQADLFEATYKEVMSEAADTALAAAVAVPDQADVDAVLDACLRATFHFMLEDIRRAKLVCNEAMAVPGPEVAEKGARRLFKMMETFAKRLAGEDAGGLDPTLAGVALGGVVRNLLAVGAAEPEAATIDQLADAAIELHRRILGMERPTG